MESIGGPEGVAVWDNLWEVLTHAMLILRSIRDKTALAPNPLISSPWSLFNEDQQISIPPVKVSVSPTVSLQIKEALINSHLMQGASTALRSWRNARFNVFDNETNVSSAAYVSLPLGHKCLLTEAVRDVVVFFEPLALEDGTRIGSVQLAASHILGMQYMQCLHCSSDGAAL